MTKGPNGGRGLISGLSIGVFFFVVLGSQIQYKPLKLKVLWMLFFVIQAALGSVLVLMPETQTHHGSWANVLFLGPSGLLIVLGLDRVSFWLHKDHFATLSRGGMELGITGRRRYRDTDILFSVLSFVLPFLFAEWLVPKFLDFVAQ